MNFLISTRFLKENLIVSQNTLFFFDFFFSNEQYSFTLFYVFRRLLSRDTFLFSFGFYNFILNIILHFFPFNNIKSYKSFVFRRWFVSLTYNYSLYYYFFFFTYRIFLLNSLSTSFSFRFLHKFYNLSKLWYKTNFMSTANFYLLHREDEWLDIIFFYLFRCFCLIFYNKLSLANYYHKLFI